MTTTTTSFAITPSSERLQHVANEMEVELENNLPENSVHSVFCAHNQVVFTIRKDAAITSGTMHDVFLNAFVDEIEVSEYAISGTASGHRWGLVDYEPVKVICILEIEVTLTPCHVPCSLND